MPSPSSVYHRWIWDFLIIFYWCPLKFFLCIKNKGRFPLLEFDLFSLFRLAKEKYNDEQRYTFYRTADVWSADFFT